MKIYKQRNLSFSIKPYGLAGKQYLSLAVAAFFDLTAPGDPLTEQDMWKAVPDELGPGGVLDMGMPKTRGEVLAAGSCFAPRGETVRGAKARIRVGSVDKTVNVFGDRFWMPDGTISRPRPFAEQPIVYENAFGGAEYKPNPIGRGIDPVKGEDGENRVFLPNVEDPSNMVGAGDDRPAPAGFRPLNIMWPQRAGYNGTYDDRWKRERWPDMPDDTNYLLFNEAPKDQWITDFFRGDETIEVENMHPDMRLIQGALPGLRARMFVTLYEDYKPFTDLESFSESFIEVPARLETVWLFPSILRGVAIYRGSVENRDDEYRDAVRVFLEWERLSETPGTIEEYAEKQKEAMKRHTPIDMAVFKKAGEKMAKAMKKVKNSPKDLARIKKAALGETPAMPRSPEEIAAAARKTAAGNLETIGKVEKTARDLHAQFGHMAEMDLGRFDRFRDKVSGALSKVEAGAARIRTAMDKASAEKADLLKEGNAYLDKNPNMSLLKAQGIDTESFAKEGYDPNFRFSDTLSSGVPFHDAGFPFVVECRRRLENDADALQALRDLGISDRLTARAWLGINPETVSQPAKDWGLDENEEPVVLPAGLVLPRFDGKHLNRILIRTDTPDHDYKRFAGDRLVAGSDETSLFLPPPGDERCCVRTADELQARFMEEEIGDACGVVVLETPQAKPDKEGAEALAEAEALAVILPEGNLPDGAAFLEFKKAYDNAVPVILPKGKTVFEAKAAGVDVRALVMEVLPPEFAKKHVIDAELPAAGEAPSAPPVPPIAFPKLNIGKEAGDAVNQARAKLAPTKTKLLAMQTELEDLFAPKIAEQGHTLEELRGKAAEAAKLSPSEQGKGMLEGLVKQKETLRGAKALTPEREAEFEKAEARLKKTLTKADAKYKAAKEKIAASKETFAKAGEKIASRTIPGMTREEMAAAGIDPDLVRPMTREEVVERHAKGLSFARRNLTGLDLSGLDLTGIDLSEAIVKKTNFTKSILKDARLDKLIAPDAIFCKANLSGASMRMGVLTRADMRKANLSGVSFEQATFQEANLEKADFTDADLRLSLMQKAKAAKARFNDASMYLTIIDRTNMPKADFRGANLNKCLVKRLAMDKADFSGARIESVMFGGVTGEKVRFTGADMTKARLGQKTDLSGADFRDAILRYASFRESDVSGADFRGSVLDRAMFMHLKAAGANFNRVSARHASIGKTDLAGADMYGMNMFMGSLRKSRLTGADLRRSNMYAVDFYKSIVGGTRFDDAILNLTVLHDNTDMFK